MGGMQGILARRAEDVHDGLDEPQRTLARQVFLRLVVLGDGAEDTRRRVPRRELGRLPAGRQAVDLVLERFGRARLLTLDRDDATGDATVEIAHEALLQAWPRLGRWVDEARDDLRLHRALAVATADWEAADRHPDFLLTGTRLDQLDDWEPTSQVVTTTDEDRFIAASRDHRDDLVRQETARRDHELALEQRSMRRLRGLVSVLVVALVVGAGLTSIALAQRRTPGRPRARPRTCEAALVAAELAHARELAATAVANRERDPDLAVNLAQHALQIVALAGETVPTDLTAALHWALQSAGATYPVHDAPVAVLEGPDGPRGVFDVGPEVLVEMIAQVAPEELQPDECLEYLDSACPDLRPSLLLDAKWARLDPPRDPARPLAGTSVTVLTTDDDDFYALSGLEAMLAATGIRVQYDSESTFHADALDTGTMIDPRIDLGTVPQPSEALRLGRQGSSWTCPNGSRRSQLHRDLSEHLVSLVTTDAAGNAPATDGHVWGLPYRLEHKSLVWYPVPEFDEAGYEVPTTWAELEVLVARIEADGRTPWCHGEEDGPLWSGWPGTDWIEDIVLQTEGPETYDAWVAGDLAFSDPAIRRAFERFDQLVLAPGRVWQGREGAAELVHYDAKKGLLDDPPSCWLFHKTSFAFIGTNSGDRKSSRSRCHRFATAHPAGQSSAAATTWLVPIDPKSAQRWSSSWVRSGRRPRSRTGCSSCRRIQTSTPRCTRTTSARWPRHCVRQ